MFCWSVNLSSLCLLFYYELVWLDGSADLVSALTISTVGAVAGRGRSKGSFTGLLRRGFDSCCVFITLLTCARLFLSECPANKRLCLSMGKLQTLPQCVHFVPGCVQHRHTAFQSTERDKPRADTSAVSTKSEVIDHSCHCLAFISGWWPMESCTMPTDKAESTQ